MTWTSAALAVIALVAWLPQTPVSPPAPTRIVHFTPPPVTGGSTRPGTCQRSLVSDRSDTFRCVAGDMTSDPCFATNRAGVLVCDADPRDPSIGTLVTTVLPDASHLGPRGDKLRAWFFELEDGSTCRPLIFGAGRQVDGMVEHYTCRFAPPGSDAVLDEIDTHAPVWTIQQASLNKRALPLSIKQLVSAVVKTAWQ